jgi:hypothetical protein
VLRCRRPLAEPALAASLLLAVRQLVMAAKGGRGAWLRSILGSGPNKSLSLEAFG